MVRVNPLYAFFISTLYLSYTYFIPPSYPLYTSLLSTLFLLHTYRTFYHLHTHNIPPLYPYPQYTFFIPTLYPPLFIPFLYLLHTHFVPPSLSTFSRKNVITIPSLRYRKAKELTVRLDGWVKTIFN